MKFAPYIIELLGKKCGKDIQIAADCEFLALDIESKTKIHIGATTLKRLAGFTNDEREPHVSTLNSIANYLGYSCWNELIDIANKSNSTLDRHENEIRHTVIPFGSKIEIKYHHDRKIIFRHLGKGLFEILESVNSKLQEGDTGEILHFVLNHPLFI